eukprot:365867-Chlamydomonas_euryale.AAC.8
MHLSRCTGPDAVVMLQGISRDAGHQSGLSAWHACTHVHKSMAASILAWGGSMNFNHAGSLPSTTHIRQAHFSVPHCPTPLHPSTRFHALWTNPKPPHFFRYRPMRWTQRRHNVSKTTSCQDWGSWTTADAARACSCQAASSGHVLTPLPECPRSRHFLCARAHATFSVHVLTPLPECTCSRRFPSARAHATFSVHVLTPLSQCTCSRRFTSAHVHAASRVHVLTPLPECTCSRRFPSA